MTTNRFNIPEVFVRSMESMAHTTGGAQYSVTQLIDSAQIAHLKRKHEASLVEDVNDLAASWMGSAIHEILADSVDSKGGEMAEKRFHSTLGSHSLSGSMDVLSPLSQGSDRFKISDYKTTSVASYMHNMEGKAEHIAQLNMYRWLCERNGISVDELEIIFVLKDWSKIAGKRTSNYPDAFVKVLPIEPWTLEYTQTYIEGRIKAHTAPVPEPCTKEEQWRSETRYAVVKPGAKRATKLCNTRTEAMSYINENMLIADIEDRPGRATRCEDYCPVRDFCEQRKGEQ